MNQANLSVSEADQESLSPPIKEWMAKIIGGAVIADGQVHASELVHIDKMVGALINDPDSLALFHKIIQREVPPPIEPYPTDPQTAERILRYILEICACDSELQPMEVRYIHEAGMAMGMEIPKIHKMIRKTIQQVRLDLLNEIMEEVINDEKRWIAVVILKLIYADGQVSSDEFGFLSSVYDLVGGDSERMEQVKADAKNIPLNELPEVNFNEETATKILRYLLEIIMGDISIDPAELKMIRQIAILMNYDKYLMDGLMDMVDQVMMFLNSITH